MGASWADEKGKPVKSPVKVTLGYSNHTGKLFGIHIYNRNRLIRMYERFGAQLQVRASSSVSPACGPEPPRPYDFREPFATSPASYASSEFLKDPLP